MEKTFRKKWESVFSDIKRKHDEINKENFFDVQIHCQTHRTKFGWGIHRKSIEKRRIHMQFKCIILPAHRYVLSSRSLLLTEQLASGENKLNWTEFEEQTCIAVLRWIYTNEVAFGHSTEVTAEQCILCTRRSSRFRRLYAVSKKVGSSKLMQRCLELRLNVPDVPPEELEVKIVSPDELEVEFADENGEGCSGSENCLDEENQVPDKELEELSLLHKSTFGYYEFQQFSDTEVEIENNIWRAHAHVLNCRSKKILKQRKHPIKKTVSFVGTYGVGRIFLRWIYTDCVVFAEELLEASNIYELPALFERCEDALVDRVNITSFAHFHEMATNWNAPKILKRCNQLIDQYFNKPKSPDSSKMDHDIKIIDSLSEMMVCESPTEAFEGLLTLNDDCLLHLFRFVSEADLGSIKDTCKRLRSLADQSFRLCKEKSLKISSRSMFADIWVLKHFGKFIKSLILDSFNEEYATFNNILENIVQCVGEDLKAISIRNCDARESQNFECLKTVLKNVECIELSCFKYDMNINSLLGYCENLKEVTITGDYTKLNFDWCSKNSNVTKLALSFADDEIFEETGKTLTRLESLFFQWVGTERTKILHLSRLSHLRKMQIGASETDQVLQHFKDKTVLENLCLSYADLTGSLASVLGEFPNLSNLNFQSCSYFDENVQDILSKKLVNIETLIFHDCGQITFEVIKRIIENLFDLKKLIVCHCNKVEFINRYDYLSLYKMRNLRIVVDRDIYTRTCELIGNNLLANVQVKPFQQGRTFAHQ